MLEVSMAAAPRNAAFDAFILGAKTYSAPPAKTETKVEKEVPVQVSTKSISDHGRGFDAYILQSVPSSSSEDSTPTNRADHCEKMPVLQTESKNGRSRKVRKDKQTAKACARCRMMKLKCDSGRPCLGCIRKGCAASCVDWDRTRALCRKFDNAHSEEWVESIERPIAWKPCAAIMDDTSFTTHDGRNIGLESLMGCAPREFLSQVMRKLMSANRMDDWMKAFSNELVDSLTEYIKVVAMQSSGIRQTFKMKSIPGSRNITVCNHSVEGSLDVYPGVAYVKYSPSGNTCNVNEGYCRMMNAHPEEVMARMKETDFCHAFTDVDALASLLDQIQLTANPRGQGDTRIVSRYFAMSRSFRKAAPPGLKPVLIHMTIRMYYSASGAVECMEKFMRPISAEEYNLARRLTPHLCRPFSDLIGDHRSAEQLLATYEEERGHTLTALSSTAAGAERMRALGRCIRGMSAKIISDTFSAAPWTDHVEPCTAVAHSQVGADSGDHCGASDASTPMSPAGAPDSDSADSPGAWRGDDEGLSSSDGGDGGGAGSEGRGGALSEEEGWREAQVWEPHEEDGREQGWRDDEAQEAGGCGGLEDALGGAVTADGVGLLAEILNAQDAGLLAGEEDGWWDTERASSPEWSAPL